MNKTEANPIGHVTDPYVVGSSIIAVHFDQGVLVACDTLLSYGGLLKYKDIQRITKIKNNMVIACTGEYADFQEIKRKLENLEKESYRYDDNIEYSVQEYANYLSSIAYEKRNKMNPYYNSTVIAGYEKNGEIFLGNVDLYGNYFVRDYVVCGFAKHFAMPLLANYWNKTRTEAEAKEILRQCFEVLFQRDCHAGDSIQFSVVDRNGVRIEEPVKVEGKWNHREIRGRANERLWQ